MARNTLKLDISGFEAYLKKLEQLGGDAKKTATEALERAARKITADTETALSPQYLPRGGKYSRSPSKTMASVVRDQRVTWEGDIGWVPVGFDFSMPGAGGYLITGTPKMQPDAELHKMYKQTKYMHEIQKMIEASILDEIVKM